MRIIQKILLGLCLCSSNQVKADFEDTVNQAAKKRFEQIFSTAVLLTDSESISFGISNFDPTSVLPDDNGPDADSIERRDQLKVYNLPFSIDLDAERYWFEQLNIKFSYIDQTEKQIFSNDNLEESNKDISTDYIYSSYVGVSKHFIIDQYWSVIVGGGGYFMYHDNDHEFNSSESESIKDLWDGVITNTHATAFVVEPYIKFDYQVPKRWGSWKWQSQLSLFTGTSLSGPNTVNGIRPEGTKLLNGVKYFYDLNSYHAKAEELFFKFHRVDLNGDMVESFGTDHFYEIGGGVLFDISRHTDLLENVGIGININKGSDFNGGSIVIYFNQI